MNYDLYQILLSLSVCKQTFHIPHMHISQKVKSVTLANYWQTFKFALVIPLIMPDIMYNLRKS